MAMQDNRLSSYFHVNRGNSTSVRHWRIRARHFSCNVTMSNCTRDIWNLCTIGAPRYRQVLRPQPVRG
eukprot:2232370-Pyramimonas_sp.AAC.1